MTYSQVGPLLTSQLGVPFVTVGTVVGVNFGPTRNPTSTTGGLQEAYTAVTTATGPYYGYRVWVIQTVSGTGQVSVPAQTTTIMDHDGGIAVGPTVLNPGAAYNFIGVNTVGVAPYVGMAVVVKQVSAVFFYGFAVTHNVSGMVGCLGINGTRDTYMQGLFLNAFNTASPAAGGNGAGLIMFANGGTGDTNVFVQPVAIGDPAFQYGAAGDTGQMNDCSYIGAIFEGPAFVPGTTSNAVMLNSSPQGGANHVFYNGFGCHSAPAVGQVVVSCPSASSAIDFTLDGGEIGVSGGVGNWATIQNGRFALRNVQWSSGQIALSGSNGFFKFTGCHVSGATCTLTSSAGKTFITDTYFDTGSFTFTETGANNEVHVTNSYLRGGWSASAGTLTTVNCYGTNTFTLSGSAIFAWDVTSDYSGATLAGAAGTIYPPSSNLYGGTTAFGFGTLTFTGTVASQASLVTAKGVALLVGSTTIVTLALGLVASALYQVKINVTSIAPAITGTLTCTYTDLGSNATVTQSVVVAAISAGAGASYTFLCNAKTGVAITAAGTASTGSDLLASGTIGLA